MSILVFIIALLFGAPWYIALLIALVYTIPDEISKNNKKEKEEALKPVPPLAKRITGAIFHTVFFCILVLGLGILLAGFIIEPDQPTPEAERIEEPTDNHRHQRNRRE